MASVRRGLVVAAVTLVACGGATPAERADRSTGSTPHPLVFPRQLIEVVPRDAIPSIDDPKFIGAEEATWLAAREPVVSLDIGGDARAYPLQILTWHEIVNDAVGGVPVAVTYCPLCNSAVVYDRRVGSRVLEFGTSGMLYRSSLVMYDRQTGSLWTHFDGRAVRGELTGTQLASVPAQLLSFAQWKREYPNGKVLSRDTGVDRDYGTNPYEYYDSQDAPIGEFFIGGWDRRLPPLDRVVGVALPKVAVAYPYRRLEAGGKASVIQDHVGDTEIVVMWAAGVASALDGPSIADSQDVGTSGVFVPTADGRPLTFTATGGHIVDLQTGSTWNVAGRATHGPLQGTRLEPVPHLDAFWFAWQAYYPETRLHGFEA